MLQQQQYPYVCQHSSHLYSYPIPTHTAVPISIGPYSTPANIYQHPSSVAAHQYLSTEYSPGYCVKESSSEALNASEEQIKNKPCKIKCHSKQNSLLSSEINKQLLRTVDEVLKENAHLCIESCAGTLWQRLAKEAIFGEDIMKRCTFYGIRESPGLPRDELYAL